MFIKQTRNFNYTTENPRFVFLTRSLYVACSKGLLQMKENSILEYVHILYYILQATYITIIYKNI